MVEERRQAATLLFMKALPGLLRKYQTDPVQACPCFLAPLHVPLDFTSRCARHPLGSRADTDLHCLRFPLERTPYMLQAAALAGIMTDLQLEIFSLRKAEPALQGLLHQVPLHCSHSGAHALLRQGNGGRCRIL